MLARSIIAQQISVAAARTINARVVELVSPGRLSADALMAVSPERLRAAGVSQQKAGYLLDLANREAIAACIGTARENARQVRGEISSEMWQEINRLYLGVQMRRLTESEWTAGTHEFLTSVIEGVHLFQGVTDSTMTHSEGWHFIELGRYLGRGRHGILRRSRRCDCRGAWSSPGLDTARREAG